MSSAEGSAARGCDCHLHENQVCDVCQGVDPDNPAKDAEPSAASSRGQRSTLRLPLLRGMRLGSRQSVFSRLA